MLIFPAGEVAHLNPKQWAKGVTDPEWNTTAFRLARLTGASALPVFIDGRNSASFQLIGDLTVHGVTRPVTWQVTAQFGDASVSGAASTTVNISDFGMSPPKAGPVLSIEDGLTLELAFTAAREA